ncbi:Cytochrome P450 71A21 [Dendrobium catenatum]|uniref:Cytochrome P450 71A21 n=1 Tax=Dendrobium catenatum TaxID=906689 RepID=A0A2I0WUR4_9ASPA|nr:Cytochrome P450 71A21 [Dendrobium catenatum]
MLLQLGSISTLVVSSPSTARKIMRTHDLVFASRPSLKAAKIFLYNNNDMALAAYGDYWRQTMMICVTNLLSLKMIQSFSLVRMEELSLMIERIARMASANNGVVCVSEILNKLTSDDYFPWIRWLDVLFGLESELRRHSKKWDALLGEFVEEHVSQLAEGETTSSTCFIDVLLQLQKDSSMPFVLTNEQIKALLLVFILNKLFHEL